ncbi:polysaccharide deacetylase family protein [Pseudalkalibacillus sp. SCS-8]|uniref:polysaccharide deacetylase family protein n=1 Tax=Pseudalkalibacillus nanhaiensis TaxID=3115291 RepID=UPI0032DA939C
MKQLLIWMLVLVLAGCAASPANEKPVEQDTEETEDQSKEESPTEGEEGDNEEEATDEENQSEEEEKPTEEEPEISYTINPANWTLKAEGEADSKVVLLTIDDAPDKHALEMAEKLKELDVPAIFFVNGHFMDTKEEKAIVKQIHELGFHIGNHTMTHSNLSKISEEKQREEIVQLSGVIEEVTGEAPIFFRAPFGVNTDYAKKVLKEQGMTFMNWTYGYDWEREYQTSAAIADIMVNTPLLTDGAILLMHDRTWSNEALVEIVKGLRDKGYSFADPSHIK